MKQCQRKRRGQPLSFAYAFKSFVGYLEGTEKAAHTIKNYQSDLRSFEAFLGEGLGSKPVSLASVTREDLEKFHGFLKKQGFKTNTRRRKLLTVRKLLRYLSIRKKLAIDVGKKLPAPHKVERVPWTIDSERLLAAIRALPTETELGARNRALFWTLAESGCQVSEVTRLRFENFSSTGVSFGGKSQRSISISSELLEEIQRLRQSAAAEKTGWIFLGHNRAGPLGSPITPRGVELLVKAYAPRLGFDGLTPRTFRHSAVLRWHRQGASRDEIQKRLGLRTQYAFRAYEPLLNPIVTG